MNDTQHSNPCPKCGRTEIHKLCSEVPPRPARFTPALAASLVCSRCADPEHWILAKKGQYPEWWHQRVNGSELRQCLAWSIHHWAATQRREGHSALRVRDGKIETFDPHPHISGEMFISVTESGYICAYGKESRTAPSWQDLIAWLKHHGEDAILAAPVTPVSGNGTEPPELDWTKCGIVELAVRNPNVASYVEHWEGRAQAAEAELAALPAKWKEDSSLETWFPLTAEELARTKKELAELRAGAASHNGQGWRSELRRKLKERIGAYDSDCELARIINSVFAETEPAAPPSEANLPDVEVSKPEPRGFCIGARCPGCAQCS